ncbi:MAG: hypothetical protein JWO91_422 [Acidobacteriaceae bacterium]|nr:hypothetical protein [Acidobacteriaceae bacterium]
MQSLEKPGYSTLIETNLQETGGGTTSSGTLSASGASQLILIGQHPSGGLFFGGNCSPVGTNSLTGTVSTADAVSLVLTENTTVYTFTGTLTGLNNTMSGTYVLTSGTCQDTGNFVGQQVGQISGTYAGTLTLTNASGSDNASAVLTESPGGFTEALTLTGTHNETDTLSGIVVGNVFSVAGTVAESSVTYYGYYAPSEKAVFMVDASNDTLLGTLRAP